MDGFRKWVHTRLLIHWWEYSDFNGRHPHKRACRICGRRQLLHYANENRPLIVRGLWVG